MAERRSKLDTFEVLTWADIQDWAGDSVVSRGRSCQRDSRVQELARTPSGGLVAWVQGTQRHATLVDIEGEDLTSACTCPYAGVCKHAVAVVLQYLDHLKQGIEIPAVAEQDGPLALLQQRIDSEGRHEVDEDDEYDDSPAPVQPAKAAPQSLRTYLKKQTKAQLIALLADLAKRYPDVRGALQDRRDLSEGAVEKLVSAVMVEIETLTAQPGWTSSWSSEGYIPDYSPVRDRLAALLAEGYADAVVALGKELLEAGTRHVEESNDEGETEAEIASCLDIAFQALPQSSLAAAEQMLWAVEAELDDASNLCDGAKAFWDREHSVEDWNTLADTLTQRLDECGSVADDEDFLLEYQRDSLTDWLVTALRNSRRQEEIIPLCEREAQETGSYVRLVDCLIEANRKEEATLWIHKGIEATKSRWPGTASRLRDARRQMLEEENDWLQVAAFRAEDFFERPSPHAYEELRNAAERAAVWVPVRSAAVWYLETGELPRAAERAAGDQTAQAWPLPETGLIEATERSQADFPMIETLIDIAIAEKRPDDVLRWYDQREPGPGLLALGLGLRPDDRVADAVADAHPDRAVAIWKELAEGQIAQTQTKAYEVAAGHLRKIRLVLQKLDREKEWESYLAEVRQTNARKRRLLEILDGLQGRRILGGS